MLKLTELLFILGGDEERVEKPIWVIPSRIVYMRTSMLQDAPVTTICLGDRHFAYVKETPEQIREMMG